MKSAEECWTQFSCNNCIHHFKTKFVLIHHRMPQHAENITLVITAFITLTRSLFLWIMEWPNMQKTVFLPSLHVTLQNKICFYESWNCTPCILRTLNKQWNTFENNSIIFPWQRWIFSYKAIHNRTSATEVSDFGKNNAKTTPCQYCNNTFDRKSVFTVHIEQNISESKWTGPLSSVVGVTSELVAGHRWPDRKWVDAALFSCHNRTINKTHHRCYGNILELSTGSKIRALSRIGH